MYIYQTLKTLPFDHYDKLHKNCSALCELQQAELCGQWLGQGQVWGWWQVTVTHKNLFNRPGLTGAVLQTPLISRDSLSQS